MSAVAEVKKPEKKSPAPFASMRPLRMWTKETMCLGTDMAALSAERGKKGVTDIEIVPQGLLVRGAMPGGALWYTLVPSSNVRSVAMEEIPVEPEAKK